MGSVAAGQSLGQRETQEDAIRVIRQSEAAEDSDLLLLLADGMGGHAGGEVASIVALETFLDHFQNVSRNMRVRGRLRESLDAANAALAVRTEDEPELAGMGCTLIGVLVAAGRLVWVSVGDSILYLIRNGQIRRLNADHSLHGELLQLVEQGKLSRQEADAHPNRNALRSALTGEPVALVDLGAIELDPGDLVLLASDGIETLGDDDIARIVEECRKDGSAAVRDALLGAVEHRDKPRQDNTSLIVLRGDGARTSGFHRDAKWTLGRRPGLPVTPILAGLAGAVVLGAAGFLLARGEDPAPAPSPPSPVQGATEIEEPAEPAPPPEAADPDASEPGDATEAQDAEPASESDAPDDSGEAADTPGETGTDGEAE